jgi:hypothetical protein
MFTLYARRPWGLLLRSPFLRYPRARRVKRRMARMTFHGHLSERTAMTSGFDSHANYGAGLEGWESFLQDGSTQQPLQSGSLRPSTPSKDPTPYSTLSQNVSGCYVYERVYFVPSGTVENDHMEWPPAPPFFPYQVHKEKLLFPIEADQNGGSMLPLLEPNGDNIFQDTVHQHQSTPSLSNENSLFHNTHEHDYGNLAQQMPLDLFEALDPDISGSVTTAQFAHQALIANNQVPENPLDLLGSGSGEQFDPFFSASDFNQNLSQFSDNLGLPALPLISQAPDPLFVYGANVAPSTLSLGPETPSISQPKNGESTAGGRGINNNKKPGQNRYGRKGTPRCAQCRKHRQKVPSPF